MIAQRTRECKEFLNSTEFGMYAQDFYLPYAQAAKRGSLNAFDRTQWPDDWNKLGKFCQDFWELLPDGPHIRHGAFFKLCDFAESWVFDPRSKL